MTYYIRYLNDLLHSIIKVFIDSKIKLKQTQTNKNQKKKPKLKEIEQQSTVNDLVNEEVKKEEKYGTK